VQRYVFFGFLQQSIEKTFSKNVFLPFLGCFCNDLEVFMWFFNMIVISLFSFTQIHIEKEVLYSAIALKMETPDHCWSEASLLPLKTLVKNN